MGFGSALASTVLYLSKESFARRYGSIHPYLTASMLDDLKLYYPATFELAFVGIVFAVVFGLLFEFHRNKRNKLTDQVLRSVSVFGVSVPSFWLALILLNIFYLRLGWFPTGQIITK